MALPQTVKSLRHLNRVCAVGVFLTAGLGFPIGPAQAQSVLLGPAPRLIKSKPVYDSRLPTGALRAPQYAGEEPGLAHLCSPRRPLCVAWSQADKGAPVLDALTKLDAAYDQLVVALGLPEPRRSDAGRAVTWHLTATHNPLTVSLEPNLSAGFDTASVVCRSGAEPNLTRSAYLCMGEAIAARLDPAETPEVRRAYALYLWWMLGEFTSEDVNGLSRVQSNPHAAVLTRDKLAQAPATALLFEYLDRSFGTESYGALPTGMLALSAARTPADATRYLNQPDVADVLRATFDDEAPVWAHHVLDFSIARDLAFEGKNALLPLSVLGDLVRPRIDWTFKVSSLPRRVAPAYPLEPWGSVYVQIDIDVPTEKLEIGIKTEWEAPVSMVWKIVKLDEKGEELGRIDVAFEQRGTEIERRIVTLENTRRLLIVGTNLGGVDLAHPFDPDHEPFEPHGCTIYVGRL